MFDIGGALRRSLKEGDAQAIRKFLISSQILTILFPFVKPTYLCHSIFNNLLIRHIGLVAYKQFVDTFSSVSVNLL